MKNDELHLTMKAAKAIEKIIQRFALLMEWRKWERRSRHAWTLNERDFARERADELKELLFGR